MTTAVAVGMTDAAGAPPPKLPLKNLLNFYLFSQTQKKV